MHKNVDFQMDWDNIRIFLSVARAGQFSAAASQLRVDNATVGRRINALEKSLGVRLFDRQTTGSVLTADGDRLYKAAEEVEAQLLRAQGDLSRSDVELSGTVRVAEPHGLIYSDVHVGNWYRTSYVAQHIARGHGVDDDRANHDGYGRPESDRQFLVRGPYSTANAGKPRSSRARFGRQPRFPRACLAETCRVL
jgi:hypothetical protein